MSRGVIYLIITFIYTCNQNFDDHPSSIASQNIIAVSSFFFKISSDS
jgi:hypothetical protein